MKLAIYRPTCTTPARATVYRSLCPERSVLYQVVQTHLETWLARPRSGRCRRGTGGN